VAVVWVGGLCAEVSVPMHVPQIHTHTHRTRNALHTQVARPELQKQLLSASMLKSYQPQGSDRDPAMGLLVPMVREGDSAAGRRVCLWSLRSSTLGLSEQRQPAAKTPAAAAAAAAKRSCVLGV
jgi:hypothetical protein